VSATALEYAITFLRWLLELDAPLLLRAKHVSCVRGEVWEAVNCLRRAQGALLNEERETRP